MGARPSSFKADDRPVVAKVPQPTGRQWSGQQQDIFNWFEQGPGSTTRVGAHGCGNLVVRARAGTGKTTTIIEGVNRAPEASILLCAFNKRIAEELNSRLANPSAEAKTLHSLGYQAIRRRWHGMPVSKGSERADYLTDTVAKLAPRQIRRLISQLHTKVRDMGTPATFEEVRGSALEFDLVPEEGFVFYQPSMKFGQPPTRVVCDLAYVVNAAVGAVKFASDNEPTYNIGIDFADMIFLPLQYQLLTQDYQLVVIDEAQDLTVAQLTIAQRVCSGRIAVVGDDKQAIYGFRGADTGSLDRLKGVLGAQELPLVTTYRCGQAIVRRAQRLVPDIQAAPSNPEGIIDEIGSLDKLLTEAKAGEFILSRINAPLVSITLQLIRRKKRARMAGRDIGAGINRVICGLKLRPNASPEDMLIALDSWERKMSTKYASYGKLDLVERCHDQADTIRALAEDSDETSVKGLLDTLGWLFVEEKDKHEDTIICSSVHKAKGLEADRVYILTESLYRRGRTQEEENIEYVATTRAKSHLSLVMGIPGLGKRAWEEA